MRILSTLSSSAEDDNDKKKKEDDKHKWNRIKPPKKKRTQHTTPSSRASSSSKKRRLKPPKKRTQHTTSSSRSQSDNSQDSSHGHHVRRNQQQQKQSHQQRPPANKRKGNTSKRQRHAAVEKREQQHSVRKRKEQRRKTRRDEQPALYAIQIQPMDTNNNQLSSSAKQPTPSVYKRKQHRKNRKQGIGHGLATGENKFHRIFSTRSCHEVYTSKRQDIHWQLCSLHAAIINGLRKARTPADRKFFEHILYILHDVPSVKLVNALVQAAFEEAKQGHCTSLVKKWMKNWWNKDREFFLSRAGANQWNAFCARCFVPPSNQAIEAGNKYINADNKRRLLESWLKQLMETEVAVMARKSQKLRFGERLSRHTHTKEFLRSAQIFHRGGNRQAPLHLQQQPLQLAAETKDGRRVVPLQGGPAEAKLDDRRKWKWRAPRHRSGPQAARDVPGDTDATDHQWVQIGETFKKKKKTTKIKKKKGKKKKKKRKKDASIEPTTNPHPNTNTTKQPSATIKSPKNNLNGAIKTYFATIEDDQNVTGREVTAAAALKKWLWSSRASKAAIGKAYLDLIDEPEATMAKICSSNKSTRPHWVNILMERYGDDYQTSPTDATLWMLSQFVILTPIKDIQVAAHRYALLKKQRFALLPLEDVLALCHQGEGLVQCNCTNAQHYGSCPHSLGDMLDKGIITDDFHNQKAKDPNPVLGNKRKGKKKAGSKKNKKKKRRIPDNVSLAA